MARLIKFIGATSDIKLTSGCGQYYISTFAGITFWIPENQIRLELQDSSNCGGPATSSANSYYRSQCIRVPAGLKVRIDVSAKIENQNAGYDTVSASIGSASLSFSSNAGSAGCTMQTRTGFCEWTSDGSIQTLYFSFSSVDERYHRNSYAHFTVTII